MTEPGTLREQLSVAHAREAALAEILAAINRSPADPGPVFDLILEKAHSLCGASMGALLLCDGDMIHGVATRGYSARADEHVRQRRPLPPGARALSRGDRVLHIADLNETYADSTSEFHRTFLDLTGARTFLMLPLRKDGTMPGLISVVRQEIRLFPDSEIALLERFATQAVIAIENAHLLRELRDRTEDLQRSVEHQAATIDVLKEMSASPGDAQPAFDLIVRQAKTLLDTPSLSLFEYDGQLVHLRGNAGAETFMGAAALAAYNSGWPRIPDRGSLTCRAILDGTIIHIRDLAKEPGISQAVRDLGHKTQISVPLMRDGRAIGAISTNSLRADGISDSQIDLLKTFAEQAVIAITGAETWRALPERTAALVQRNSEYGERIEQQAATIHVLKVMSDTPGDAQPVFDQFAEQARDFCNSEYSGILLRDGDVLQLAAAAAAGSDTFVQRMRAAYPSPIGPHSIGGRVMLSGETVLINDMVADAAYSMPRGWGIQRSAAAVPIIRDGASIGAIGIGYSEPSGFNETQVELLKTFAEQAAIAIGGAETYRSLQERTASLAERNNEFGERIEQQSATIDVLKVMSSTPDDTQPVFEQIVRRAEELCNGWSCGLHEFDGERVHLRYVIWSDTEADMAARARYEASFPMIPTRGSIPGRAISDRQIVHIRDRAADPELSPEVRALQTGQSASQVAVPLLRDGRAIGAITLSLPGTGGFTDSQIALLQTFAEQAAIAIGSTATFRSLQERTAALARRNSEYGERTEHQPAPIDYTAYGDTINIAARLEAANKQLGTRICVSGSVAERIPGFRGRPVGSVIPRGRHEALPVHEPLSEDRHADGRTAAYRDAYARAEACDPLALSAFAALLGQDSGDGLVSFHLKRLLAGANGITVVLD